MKSQLLAVLALATTVACGRSDRDRQDTALADSLSRDLELAPVDSSATLSDRSADTAEVAPSPIPEPAPKPQPPKKTPKPQPRPPAQTAVAPTPAPAAAAPVASTLTLAPGTQILATTQAELTSRKNKAGETLVINVSQDVKNTAGQVVIPAGSTIDVTITELKAAGNRGEKDGKLLLTPTGVTINGQSYPLRASVDSVEHHLKGQGVTAGGAARVGAGAAAGAIAGRVIGGKGKGALIGGLIGAAAGTAVAVESADRDVVVPAGAAVVISVSEELVVTK